MLNLFSIFSAVLYKSILIYYVFVIKMNAENVAEDIRSLLEGESVAVVGGAEPKDGGEVLRESDQVALESEELTIDETVEASYGVSGEELVEAVGDKNVYITGGTVANPYARIVNSNIDPEESNSVNFGTIVKERRFPFTFDDEGVPGREILSDGFPEDSETVDWYDMNVEEFRKNGRPNYVVDRSHGDDGANVSRPFQSIWVPERGQLTELSDTQATDYLSKRFAPVANGNDWQTDYSILGVHTNPHGEGKVVAAQGAHHLGTKGANDVIQYPDSEIEGTDSVLEAIGQFQDETGSEEYQALIQTSRNPATGETQNILYAIGEL